MFLKVGAATIIISLMLSVGVAAAVAFRDKSPEPSVVSTESRSAIEKSVQKRKTNLGQKLEIADEPDNDETGTDSRVIEDRSTEKVSRSGENGRPAKNEDLQPAKNMVSEPRPEPAPHTKTRSEPVPDWPKPTTDQVYSAEQPRHYQPPSDADMSLTIEALGLYNVPVLNSANLEVLDRGLMHDPETSLPWDGGAQRNVFIAGHYLGYPGTASHLVFYNLDKLREGDEVILKDGGGRSYRYRVSESFEATPEDSWVMGQEADRDMLTLQTCIPPNFEDRLIVRADRA